MVFPVGLALAAAALAPAGALAQTSAGRFELTLATPLVSHSKLSADVAEGQTDIDTAGTLHSSTTTLGIHDEAALELGYGLGELFVLGAVASFGRLTVEYEAQAASGSSTRLKRSTLFLAPKLDVMLLPAARVRPWVGLAAGLIENSIQGLAGMDQATDASESGFQLQARLGLRCFAAERFSIDPAIAFSWATVSGDFVLANIGETVSTSGTRSGYALLVGASGWL